MNKLQKIDPTCPQNVCTGSSTLVRVDTLQISKNPKFFAPKGADVWIWRTPLPLSALDNLPRLRTSFMDSSFSVYLTF